MLRLTFDTPYPDLANWQGNNSQKARCLQILQGADEVLGTTTVARFECASGDVWAQVGASSGHRSLIGCWEGTTPSWSKAPAYPPEKEGEDWYWVVAVDQPSDAPVPIGKFWERHCSNNMGSLAPVQSGLFFDWGGNLMAALCSGQAMGNGWEFQKLHEVIVVAPKPGRHYFVWRQLLKRVGGAFEIWHQGPEDTSLSKVLSYLNVPAWGWASSLPDECPYTQMGLYPASDPGRGPGQNYLVHHGVVRCPSFAEALTVVGSTSPAPPVPTPPPVTYKYESSIPAGAKLNGTETWLVTSTNPLATKVEFYADSKLIATDAMSAGKAEQKLSLTPSSVGGGYHVLDASNNILYRSPTIPWTVIATPVHVVDIPLVRGFVSTAIGELHLTDVHKKIALGTLTQAQYDATHTGKAELANKSALKEIDGA